MNMLWHLVLINLYNYEMIDEICHTYNLCNLYLAMYTKGGDTTCNTSSVCRGWYLYITVYEEGTYISQCTKMVPLSHSVQRKDTHLSHGIKEILSVSNTVHRRGFLYLTLYTEGVTYISHYIERGTYISHCTQKGISVSHIVHRRDIYISHCA